MKIVVDFAEKKISSLTGKISSNICIEITESLCFPSCGWVDFSISLLNVWTKELIEVLTNNSGKIVLYFMEGDYVVHIKKLDNSWKVFYGTYDDYGELFKEDKNYPQKRKINLDTLSRNLIKCNRLALESLSSKEHDSIESLVELNNKLLLLVKHEK